MPTLRLSLLPKSVGLGTMVALLPLIMQRMPLKWPRLNGGALTRFGCNGFQANCESTPQFCCPRENFNLLDRERANVARHR